MVISELKGLEAVEDWTRDLHIIRHGYHGGSYDGNNSKRILDNCERLRAAFGLECFPAVDALNALGAVCSGEKNKAVYTSPSPGRVDRGGIRKRTHTNLVTDRPAN